MVLFGTWLSWQFHYHVVSLPFLNPSLSLSDGFESWLRKPAPCQQLVESIKNPFELGAPGTLSISTLPKGWNRSRHRWRMQIKQILRSRAAFTVVTPYIWTKYRRCHVAPGGSPPIPHLKQLRAAGRRWHMAALRQASQTHIGNRAVSGKKWVLPKAPEESDT